MRCTRFESVDSTSVRWRDPPPQQHPHDRPEPAPDDIEERVTRVARATRQELRLHQLAQRGVHRKQRHDNREPARPADDEASRRNLSLIHI